MSDLCASSKFERVKSALNSDHEVTLRTIYDDLASRFVEWFAPSHLFKSMQRKELGLVLL